MKNKLFYKIRIRGNKTKNKSCRTLDFFGTFPERSLPLFRKIGHRTRKIDIMGQSKSIYA